jgi:predicted O-methyltransferase YrrM
VANGFSSAAILQALEENGRGVLASIDLPHLHPRAVSSVGAAVHPSHRGRWQLHLGGVDDLLPRVLEDRPEVDIFVQDASHTVAGQLKEFQLAWPRIRSGGILMADDVTPALPLFHREAGGRAMLVRQAKEARIGILVKTPAPVP